TDRCLTLCLGGDWHDLGGGQVGLQPYRNIHELEERSFRYEWTLDRLAESDITLEDDARWSVAEALDKLARARPPERTFSEFVFVLTEMLRIAQVGSRNRHSPHYMRLKKLRDALSHIVRALSEFTRGHLHGHFLDADHDDIRQAPIQTFEQESLLRTPRMVKPVVSHVFHELELGFDTSHPTLLLMDDAAVAWVLPDYEEKGKEWMVTKAKKGVSMGFFTHSLVQVFGSKLGGLLLESCPTRFILPNPAARAPELAAIYHRMGLNEEEIRLIATARSQ